MPVRKPKSLIVRHETAAEQADRSAREASVRPARGLPMQAPARLKGHPAAREVWRRTLRTYAELEGEIVTRLDMDLLVDYCILMEQVAQVDRMRQVAYREWLRLAEKVEELDSQGRADDAVLVAVKVIDAFDATVKLDARADQKRKTLHQWRQSLYLTPRARAGVAPSKKEEEAPPDDMEQLLGEITNYVNGGE